MEAHYVVLSLDLNVEQVANLPFVLDVPTVLQGGHELAIEGLLVVVRVGGEEIINIASDEQHLFAFAVLAIRFALNGEHAFKPREQSALPTTAGLRHPVDGFLDTENAGTSVSADVRNRFAVLHAMFVSRGQRTVDHFAFFEFALKVGGYEVPTTHAEAPLGGDGTQDSKGGGTHGGAEGLIIVHAGDLRAALDAQTGLLLPATFGLVGPCHAHEASAVGRHFTEIDFCP
eukprot:7383010-Prymnesium_polylepis.1